MTKNQLFITISSVIVGLSLVLGAIILSKNDTSSNETKNLITITSADLAKANGKDGNNCYVAIEKNVYEISQGNKWKDGEHITSEGQAYCGRDLTDVISKSPHGKSVLSLLSEVGILQN